jgi:hypothetical protein
VVRGEKGVVLPFYSPERSRGRDVEAVGGEVGGRPPLLAMSSMGWQLRGGERPGDGGGLRSECGGVITA